MITTKNQDLKILSILKQDGANWIPNLCINGEFIYACGGNVKGERSKRCMRYNLLIRKWDKAKIPDLNQKIIKATMIALEHKWIISFASRILSPDNDALIIERLNL